MSGSHLRVLLVGDENQVRQFEALLAPADGFETVRWNVRRDPDPAMMPRDVDLCVLEHACWPDVQQVFAERGNHMTRPPAVVLADTQLAGLQAIRDGAAAYLQKRYLTTASLARCIHRALTRCSGRLKLPAVLPGCERHLLQAVLDLLPVGVFIADRRGRLIAVNTFATNIWGHLPVLSPTLGDFAKDYPACNPRGDRPVPVEERSLHRAVIRGERVIDEEFEIPRPEGRRTVASQAAPVRDSDGAIYGGICVSADITELKRVQRQLHEAQERTRALLVHQEQLRAMAASLTIAEQHERRHLAAELHDYLAQLLVAGKMRSKLVSQTAGTPEARAAVDELRGLIDEALKYTRSMIADLCPTILFEAGLYAAMNWLGEQMQRQNLQVTIEQQGEPVELPTDQAIIVFHAVRELLVNVSIHSGTGEAMVQLEHRPSRELVITVTDRGNGFDLAHYPLELAKGKFGLFSVRERLIAAGATLDLQSSPGRGTRAIIRVPLLTVGSTATQSLRTEEIAPASSFEILEPPASRCIRVLLADDHKMVREGFRNLIEADPQLEVVGEASNGEEATELARVYQPDVVLMDINMPRMNGIEATRRIKAELPRVAVIGLSVHDDRSLISSMLEAGASAYLTKDGDSEDLARAIRRACPPQGQHFSGEHSPAEPR